MLQHGKHGLDFLLKCYDGEGFCNIINGSHFVSSYLAAFLIVGCKEKDHSIRVLRLDELAQLKPVAIGKVNVQ